MKPSPDNKFLKNILIREQIIDAIRAFFKSQGLHEVITPALHEALPLEPNLYAFETTWHLHDHDQKMYLACSPEVSMKKYIAAGIGECFAIGHSFRNLESSSKRHRPEFLMLEWYRMDKDYRQIMQDTQDMMRSIKKHLDTYNKIPPSSSLTYQNTIYELESNWPVLSLDDLMHQYSGLRIEEVLSDEKLQKIAKQKGYTTENATWDALFDQIFLNEVEPHLPQTPFFLIDFPAQTSPLCKPREDKPHLCERFEIYFAGLELGNGNTENTNVKKMRELFEVEKKHRAERNMLTPPIDEEFLQSLESLQDKTFAGIGLGIERLTMLYADTNNIQDISPSM
jgi:elongation factor P--beta-lysine ligase